VAIVGSSTAACGVDGYREVEPRMAYVGRSKPVLHTEHDPTGGKRQEADSE
jgi:hypothetical protein